VGRVCVLLAIVAAALSVAAAAGGDLPELVGTVGPEFKIDLTDASGKHVDEVTPGDYVLLVHDRSEIHNFVLGSKSTGERLAQTAVEFVGDQTFTIHLELGQYAYACSPHFEVMNGSLLVLARATTPPPVSAASVAARVDARAASVRPSHVAAGGVVITVTDRSRTRNFHLVGPGVNRKTSKSFVGKKTWTLELGSGTYRYGSDPKLSGRLVAD
jgi:hypothetical protein